MIPEHEIASDLHRTTQRLDRWLQGLMTPSSATGREGRIATPEQMTNILSELVRAGELLRAFPKDVPPNLQRELAEYRSQVERFRDFLPAIHSALLRERSRLEQERARAASAEEWVRASRQTL